MTDNPSNRPIDDKRVTVGLFAFFAEFGLHQKVYIDGCTDLIANVTGVTWKGEGILYEVSWIHCGDLKSVWLHKSRMTLADIVKGKSK